jgi:hypothetical protein
MHAAQCCDVCVLQQRCAAGSCPSVVVDDECAAHKAPSTASFHVGCAESYWNLPYWNLPEMDLEVAQAAGSTATGSNKLVPLASREAKRLLECCIRITYDALVL